MVLDDIRDGQEYRVRVDFEGAKTRNVDGVACTGHV